MVSFDTQLLLPHIPWMTTNADKLHALLTSRKHVRIVTLLLIDVQNGAQKTLQR
jgi:hypothetical protein